MGAAQLSLLGASQSPFFFILPPPSFVADHYSEPREGTCDVYPSLAVVWIPDSAAEQTEASIHSLGHSIVFSSALGSMKTVFEEEEGGRSGKTVSVSNPPKCV